MLRPGPDTLKALALVVVRRPADRSDSDDAGSTTASDDHISDPDAIVHDAVETQQGVSDIARISGRCIRVFAGADRVKLLAIKLPNDGGREGALVAGDDEDLSRV
jgi:hypothetical protein